MLSLAPELESLLRAPPSVDTRTLKPGEVFFALRGPNHDGHDHAAQALEKGAVAVVAERPLPLAGRVVVVPDVLEALQALAARRRRDWGGTVVGVTGSAGKTTTKDVIAHLLASELATGKTEGNLNNHVGVPLSILRLPAGCRVAVIEMGMNHAGELRRLSEIARPDIGVVTNVGFAHVEFFASIDEVALAKRELIESLPPEGTAVLNQDDPRVRRFREVHPGRTLTFGFSETADLRPGDIPVPPAELPLPGRHGVLNVLAGLAVARALGIPPGRLGPAIRTLQPSRMRGEIIRRNGVTIINDCYNANPEAVRSMLDLLESTPARRRLAVLGEMLELGGSAERLHREVGRYAAERRIDLLAGVRGAARFAVEAAREAGLADAFFFETPEEAGDFIRAAWREGDAVLLKGSRGVAVEKALERLLG